MATIDPHDGSDVDGQIEWFHGELMTALNAVLERTSKHLDPHAPVHSSNIMRTFWKSKVDGLVDKLEVIVIRAADHVRGQLQSHVNAAAPVAVNAGGDLLRAQLKAAGRRAYVKTRVLTADAFEIPSPTELFAEIYLRSRRGFLLDLGTDAWNSVRTELLAGLNDGDSIGELRTRVMSVADVTQPRAERIARTEVVGAMNAGSIAQVRASKLDSTKTWLATNDSRTRPSHADVDGTTVGLDQTFLVGGVRMDRPHDPTAPADEVIQCRCTLTFEISDDALTAAAFGKPDQPRDYHGRWGKGGKGGSSDSRYSTDAENIASDPDLEKKHQAVINVYTDEFGYTMNAYSRGLKDHEFYPDNEDDLADAKEFTGKLSTMFSEAKPLKEPITVYRGVEGANEIFGAHVNPGTVLADKAPMSTTAHSDYAMEYATSRGLDGTVMHIEVPKGMKAVTLSNESGGFSEGSSEILLPPNTHLQVISDRPNDGIRTIHAKVVEAR